MGKKNNVQVPTANNVANRDIIQRLNFLYQASVYLNSIPSPSATNTPRNGKGNGRQKRCCRTLATSDISRSYVKTMKIVGQKTTVKIDPSVKRTLCKGCDTVLVPGSTATVRIKSSPSHGHAVTYTCTSCKTSRRIPAPPTLAPNTEDPAIPQVSSVMHLDVDPPPTLSESLQWDSRQHQSTSAVVNANTKNKKRKKPLVPRPQPFFARPVGHVVFRGNEILNEELEM